MDDRGGKGVLGLSLSKPLSGARPNLLGTEQVGAHYELL